MDRIQIDCTEVVTIKHDSCLQGNLQYKNESEHIHS